MNHSEDPAATRKLIANRYAVERTLGRGGMATVYQVRDTSTGERLALKRLRTDVEEAKQKGLTRLFEREYYTLSQLAHPRVVAVHDYGVDPGGAYYTMELLDGGDLRDAGDTDWRRACRLMIDVCSALALVHSRRFVHRDLSPRNIRCTADGTAKVIDFGALTPMGPAQELVGTPSLAAPEVLAMQPLDARTDIYSLGATFYFTLAGRHAYPAKDFRQLRGLQGMPIAPPSQSNPNLPRALDDLVMQMIHPDPASRPVSAAEVMERLGAIADVAIDEELVVSQAYLSTPSLVGRTRSLRRVTRRVARAKGGTGASLVITGASGVGRSRLLDACVLDAKLRGVVTLRAGKSLVGTSDYAAVRTLGSQLLDAQPEMARAAARPHAAILGHVFPELLDAASVELARFDDPRRLRPSLQASLRAWFIESARSQPLVVAVDDVDGIDEPSAAFVALLAHEVGRHPIVLIATVGPRLSAQAAPALQVLAQTSTVGELLPISASDTLALLRSVFGAVPHVELIAHRIHEVALGNPRDTLQLAQHLVDRGLARYQGGVWSLPDHIDTSELPADMAEALRMRIRSLGPVARELAAAMAFRPDRGLSFEQCLRLTDDPNPGLVVQSLEELVRAGIAQATTDRYALAQRGWASPIRESLPTERARSLHLRLAECFDPADDGIVVGQHLLLGGEEERALSVLVRYSEATLRITNEKPEAFDALLRSLPTDWMKTLAEAIELADRRDLPKRQVFALRTRFSGIVAVLGKDSSTIQEVLTRLHRDSGLDIYEELSDALSPGARLARALELAHARYAETPEHERVYAPTEAIQPLARSVVICMAVIAHTQDYAKWQFLPSLAPFAPLSPALWVLEQTRLGLGHRIAGRIEQAQEIYLQLLARLSEPDRGGLEPTYHRHVNGPILRMLGAFDAIRGLSSALDWAAKLDNDPFFASQAYFVRMLYHLWQGDPDKADECRRQVDRLSIQNSPPALYEIHLSFEITAYAATDDLVRIKHSLRNVEDMAKRYTGWIPIAHFARASYHRVRGDFEAALAEITEALGLMEPGMSQVWPDAARTHVEVLNGLGRHEEAREGGERYVTRALSLGLQHAARMIKMPLAVAHAYAGESERAVSLCRECVQHFRETGAQGVVLGLAYHARAQVDAALGSSQDFEEHSSLCEAEFRKGGASSLARKAARLYRDRTQSADADETILVRAPDLDGATSLLSQARTRAERASRALQLILDANAADSGHLYAVDETGVELVASVNSAPPPDVLERGVSEYIEMRASQESTLTGGDGDAAVTAPPTEWLGFAGRCYYPVLLEHPTPAGFAVTGVVVLPRGDGERAVSQFHLTAAVSRCMADAGDVVPRLIG